MTKKTHDVSFTMCHPSKEKEHETYLLGLSIREAVGNARFEAVASFLLAGQWLRWFQKLEV